MPFQKRYTDAVFPITGAAVSRRAAAEHGSIQISLRREHLGKEGFGMGEVM
jgi:hypothetical protein